MLKRIPAALVQPGMFIQRFEGSWLAHPFWRRSFLLQEPEDLRKILDSGIPEVWIDTDKGIDLRETAAAQTPAPREPASAAPPAPPAAPPGVARALPERVDLASELGRARKLYEDSRTRMREMFAEARLGRAIDPEAAASLVEDIAASLQRNPWALISVTRLKSSDEYTYMHSVAVCALMIALGRQLQLPDEQVREAGTAGLLHDLGKARIAPAILNKAGKLSEREFDVMKTHPRQGWDMLRQVRGIGDAALDVCLHHHEKMDGTGYPDGLAGEAISLFARMGAVCDVYDAITSNRPYKKGWDPAESLRNMARWTGSHLDPRIFAAFVKSVGIYPVGSLVRLESERLGVVVEQGEGSLLTPRVRSFFCTRSRAYVEPMLVDLGADATRERIVGPENPADWGITDTEAYWQ
ncbi:MAG: HD-GYP domain-containing protein [Betaproteobacteria bacterium]|nr:HD-GYP domain-containing protein [Betaproteobacteria bacterium]MDE2151235.1 HD-GYP domain-containing protein [Betaproteobacteria bacterium]MDE2478761.1 HD-GYP domain-containing protein [Betaproteobacteria bacterium]